MSGRKYHLFLSENERRFLIQNLLWFQNKLWQEGVIPTLWMVRMFITDLIKTHGNTVRTHIVCDSHIGSLLT